MWLDVTWCFKCQPSEIRTCTPSQTSPLQCNIANVPLNNSTYLDSIQTVTELKLDRLFWFWSASCTTETQGFLLWANPMGFRWFLMASLASLFAAHGDGTWGLTFQLSICSRVLRYHVEVFLLPRAIGAIANSTNLGRSNQQWGYHQWIFSHQFWSSWWLCIFTMTRRSTKGGSRPTIVIIHKWGMHSWLVVTWLSSASRTCS